MAIFFQYNWMHELLSKSLRTPQGPGLLRTPSLFLREYSSPQGLLIDSLKTSPSAVLEDSLRTP